MDAEAFQRDFFGRLGQGLHLSALFDYLPEIYLYVKDAESRFVKVNRALCAMLGFDREQPVVGNDGHRELREPVLIVHDVAAVLSRVLDELSAPVRVFHDI